MRVMEQLQTMLSARLAYYSKLVPLAPRAARRPRRVGGIAASRLEPPAAHVVLIRRHGGLHGTPHAHGRQLGCR